MKSVFQRIQKLNAEAYGRCDDALRPRVSNISSEGIGRKRAPAFHTAPLCAFCAVVGAKHIRLDPAVSIGPADKLKQTLWQFFHISRLRQVDLEELQEAPDPNAGLRSQYWCAVAVWIDSVGAGVAAI